MKDNRDPKQLGLWLMGMKRLYPSMAFSEIYDHHISSCTVRDYGDLESQFQHAVMPPQTFAPPAGNST
jgi:hypothetical protein